MDPAFLKRAFITLFVAIDPPGLAAIFIALTAHMAASERKTTALQAVIIAFCILLAVSAGGSGVLDSLGIGFPAFRIAGGLLLFYIGFEMVFERREQRKNHTAETAVHDHPRNIAAFPLAIPLMAGPGAITATILQSSLSHSLANYVGLVAIIAAVTGICLLVFLLATPIGKVLGTTGRVVLSRLMGLLLAALAVQTVGDGIVAFTAG